MKFRFTFDEILESKLDTEIIVCDIQDELVACQGLCLNADPARTLS
jgi:hypothetical protein